MRVGLRKMPDRTRRIEPRGLRALDAAAYLGVSTTKFGEWVADGRMPRPFRVDNCVLWDRHQLDAAFDSLSDAPPVGNDWDKALSQWPKSA